MRKHTFKKKLLSVTLSALTAVSAGTVALTTAYNLPATVVYAADSLTPQESKLLKAEEKMIMGMAKEVFKDIPFFGNLVDGFDSILDLTDAFGSGSGGESISKEDLKELREHLDTELEKINQQIISMGDQLLNELGNEMYTMKIGDVIDDMYGTAVRDAERINTHLSDDSLTENEKLVEIAALIGRSNTWSSSEHKISRFWKVANLISGETVTKIDSKNLYDTIYEYFSKKVLFSGEAYDKATPYINKIVYEFLYSQSVLAQCLGASLKVANFTDEEIAALSPTQRDILSKSTVKSIEDEIGAETMMLFNFHDQKSFISLYSNYLYNAENSRFTYLNKGTAMKAVKSALGSSEPGSESGVGEIKIGKTNGSTDTNAHSAYKNEKTRLENALSSYNVISCANIGQMGTYVSSNYSNAGSVWNFLKDRGFTYTASDDKTNMLVTNSKVRDDDPFSADGSGYNTYEHRYYLGYSGYVYNNQNLSAEDITAYALVDKKERDKWAYQAITYDHYYSTYVASPVNSKPLRLFYFQDADEFKNTSTFDYDAKTNTLTVTAKSTGAVGRQNIRVQYRENDDDNWTTSYAPTTVITLKDGCTYEVRTIISDEGGHKETTDTQYFSKPDYVKGKEPYIDSNGDYKLGTKDHFEINGRNYAVNADGSRGEELRDISLSYFDFRSVGNDYGLLQYTGPTDSLTEIVVPKTYQGKKITTVGCNGNPFISTVLYKSQFVLKLNENITEIGNNAFSKSQVTKVTGNTSSLKTIGRSAFLGVNQSGGKTLDFEMDYPGEITVSQYAFHNVDVTARVKHATRLSDDGKAKSITYVFTDEHICGSEPTWKWSADHKKAQAFFTCTDERCKHYGSVDATVTTYFEGGKLVYKATAVIGGKTYTTTYTENHTHAYGEPVWKWSDDHSTAKVTFTCTECGYQETADAKITKTEKNNKIIYTATAVVSGKTYTDTYTEDKPHTHTYGAPVWNWSDDFDTAKATFTCTECEYQETVNANITKTEENNKITYTATVTFGGKTYTNTKIDIYQYVSATEPYIDDNGAYILGMVSHFEKNGKNYAVNADGSIGKELNDISVSYFDFVLNGNTYAITHYKGSYASLKNNELVIPKTFNGRKITGIGSFKQSADTEENYFMQAKGKEKQFTLTLNENITEIYENAFYDAYVTTVTGNTSSLNKIGMFAFADANSPGYYSLDIKLDYPGDIVCSFSTFKSLNVTVRMKHSANLTLENGAVDFGARKINYVFTAPHAYGEPTWKWSDDHTSATATFTCTYQKCGHTETVDATVTKTEKDNKIIYTATAVADGKTYTTAYEEKKHIHTYGTPVWNWSDDFSTAKATFTCTDGDDTQTADAKITKTEENGKITYTATATFDGKTYTDTKIEIYKYVSATEPYIDANGAYILGTVSHFEKDGTNYAVNADNTVGKKLDDISLSYFAFELLWNDEYQINCYTGSYDLLKNDELVIPKTFNGKKITHLGGTDGFMKASGANKQFTLVLNENITHLNSNVFSGTLVEKVTGNTSGLAELGGNYVFANVNSKGGYKLDIQLDNPGRILCGYKCFENVDVTVRMKHSAVLETKFAFAKNITYIFTDAHTCQQAWTWSDDHGSAALTLTCNNEKCKYTETVQATVTKTEENGKIIYTATAVIDGKTYTDTKESVYYSVTVANIEHGTVTSDKNSALKGETIHLTVTPDDPYKLGTLTVKAANGESVTVTDNSFVMPASDVTVSAVFAMKSANIFVGGERITAGNCSDILGNGTASYDFDTNTLTLTNADIEVTNGFGIRYNEGSDKPFNIVLEGTNRIADKVDDGSDTCYGIALYAAAPGFIISGTGTLDIEMASGSPRTGIHARKALTIDGTKVSVDVTGSENAIGVDLVYGDSVLKLDNGARMEINASGFALQSNRNVRNLNVDNDCFFEAISAVQAFNRNISLFDGHPTVTVSTEPSAAGSYNWNESTALTSYKYISLGGQNVLYSVKITETQHGTVTASKESVREGEEVTLTVTPDTGYELTALNVKDDNNSNITVTDNKFIMPSGNVTVSAIFTIKKYTVTWKNGDTILETDENVPYGTAPSFDGETPAKSADDNYAYIFTGWSPEISNVTGAVTYTAQFESKLHTYGEPTWNWSDDHSTAKAIFTCTDCDHQKTIDAEVEKTEDADKVTYTATATFGSKTYTNTYTEEKEATYVYYPAAEPYIDDNGAYILGYKEHYEYKGKYYAVNKDKSVGAEMTDIWVSYFSFTLLPDDTYQINKYTGPTKNLTEMLIPKTFNGKKITTIGTDKMDVFTRSGKPIYTLVLNENITEIKPNAFYSTGVTKVTGNTSGLSKIGDYAFSWVNSANGNTLDITLDYPGMITIGDSIFTHTNVTVRISHATTLSSTKLGALSIKYDFTDAHTYGEPVWDWDEDFIGATVTRTCTHPNCKHSESVLAEFVQTTDEDGVPFIEAVAKFSDAVYHDIQPVYKTEAGGYIVEVTGRFKGGVDSGKHNLVGTEGFRVVFRDKGGNKVNAPQYIWVAQESASEGIVVDPNGDVSFTKEGDFHVQLRSPDGNTVYSPWITVRAYRGGDDGGDEQSSQTINPKDDMPKTGDASSAAAVAAVLLASLSAALFLSMKRKKDER